MGKKGAQCRVCSSPDKDYYETLYYKSRGNISWVKLAEESSTRGEGISRKSFERHFNNGHYTPESVQRILDKGVIDERVEQTRTEAIDILDEIKMNLTGLKTLIETAKASKNVSDVVAVYREHRLTLQDVERLRNKLSRSTTMTEAELYREIFWACSELCPKCREHFWVKLDERLKRKNKRNS